jgi:hypothetical protein
MRIVDIIDTEEDLGAEALFDAVLDLLPLGEFPPIDQPAAGGAGVGKVPLK